MIFTGYQNSLLCPLDYQEFNSSKLLCLVIVFNQVWSINNANLCEINKLINVLTYKLQGYKKRMFLKHEKLDNRKI